MTTPPTPPAPHGAAGPAGGRPDRTMWLGVELGGQTCGPAAPTAAGTLRAAVAYPHGLKRGEPGIIAEAADKALDAAQLTWEGIAGVAVGIAGLVDWHSGVVIDAGNLGWHDYELGRELARRFGLPVMVENDVCAAAMAEMADMPVTTAPWLYVSVGTGVGALVVISARLGDVLCLNVGHIPVPGSSAPCACGRRGCLEALASGPAFTRAVRSRIADHPGHRLFPRLSSVQGKDVLDAALSGDALCTEVLSGSGSACGWAVAELVDLFTPAGVVLAGHMLGPGSPYLSAVVAAARARIEPWMQERFCSLQRSRRGEDRGHRTGAATSRASAGGAGPAGAGPAGPGPAEPVTGLLLIADVGGTYVRLRSVGPGGAVRKEVKETGGGLGDGSFATLIRDLSSAIERSGEAGEGAAPDVVVTGRAAPPVLAEDQGRRFGAFDWAGSVTLVPDGVAAYRRVPRSPARRRRHRRHGDDRRSARSRWPGAAPRWLGASAGGRRQWVPGGL